MDRISPIVTLRHFMLQFSHAVSHTFGSISNDYNFFSKEYKAVNEISTDQVRLRYQTEKI